MKSTSTKLRLHYCHGLESGPNGYKARSLREWAEVTVPNQQMSLWDLRKSNSVARNWVRQLPRRPRAHKAVLLSLASCVQVHINTMDAPDVLIGSSWGGLVASVLLADRVWEGPTVLLCPAVWTMERKFPQMRESPRAAHRIFDALAGLPARTRDQIVLVHGTADTVVPLSDSQRLAREAGLKLVEVDGGSHGLSAIVQNGQLRDLVEDVAAISRRRALESLDPV